MKRELKTERGFTLLEVLVSIVIFTVAALGMAKAFTDHLTTNTLNERRSEAISAAQQVLDNVRTLDPATLPASGQAAEQTITFGERSYKVNLFYCFPSTYCTSNNIRQLHTEVKLNGQLIYQVDTVYAQLR
jgi:general secretion pathway protein I